MLLSKEQFGQLRRALLSAFPTMQSLRIMVRQGLNEHLSAITSENAPCQTIVFELIEWAETQGRLDELIKEAHANNPKNQELCEFEKNWRESKSPSGMILPGSNHCDSHEGMSVLDALECHISKDLHCDSHEPNAITDPVSGIPPHELTPFVTWLFRFLTQGKASDTVYIPVVLYGFNILCLALVFHSERQAWLTIAIPAFQMVMNFSIFFYSEKYYKNIKRSLPLNNWALFDKFFENWRLLWGTWILLYAMRMVLATLCYIDHSLYVRWTSTSNLCLFAVDSINTLYLLATSYMIGLPISEKDVLNRREQKNVSFPTLPLGIFISISFLLAIVGASFSKQASTIVAVASGITHMVGSVVLVFFCVQCVIIFFWCNAKWREFTVLIALVIYAVLQLLNPPLEQNLYLQGAILAYFQLGKLIIFLVWAWLLDVGVLACFWNGVSHRSTQSV